MKTHSRDLPTSWFPLWIPCLLLVLIPLGCSDAGSADSSGQATTQVAESGSGEADARAEAEIVARVGNRMITRAELEERAADDLDDLAQRRYQIQVQVLNQMIQEQLVEEAAGARGLSVQDYVRQEVQEKADEGIAAKVDELLAQEPYQRELERRLGSAKDDAEREQRRAQFRQQVEARVRQEGAQERFAALIDGLKDQQKIEILIGPPAVARADVPVTQSPIRGNEAAPVTIVEFSDFQCPYCSRAQSVLEELLERHPDQVRVAYKHFPLRNIHPQAQKAAEAAECAREQGRFWDYHDVLYENQRALAADQLVAYAQTLELDVDAFKSCLDSGEMAQRVERDVQEGIAAGVSSTPFFFVNGIKVKGAQSADYFEMLIDAELRSAANEEGAAS